MSSPVFEVKLLQDNFPIYKNKTRLAYQKALKQVSRDLQRTASECTPFEIGTLGRSWDIKDSMKGNQPTVEVSFSVTEGDFNYALKMHEENYNLGVKSRAKPGGKGMSGKQYPVGKGYLSNVLKGEQETYIKHIEKAIKEV